MKSEFVIERQGKSFVLYAGLLDLAHQQGLKSISTELVQVPSEENGRTAIVAAVVILERDGVERHFTGLGDASPQNVAPAMLNCLLRLAETRAKARALRDAVNIGTAALEELGAEAADTIPQGKCPECGAPPGAAHATRCSRRTQRHERADAGPLSRVIA